MSGGGTSFHVWQRPESLPYRINRAPVPKLARSTALLRAGLLSLAVATLIFGFLTLQMVSGPTRPSGMT